MNELHVGQATNRPPTTDVFPEWPERVAFAIQPLSPVLPDVARRRFDGWSDEPRSVVKRIVPGLVRAGMVVVQTPDHVTAVAADIEILGLGRELDRIDRQVRLEKAPVRLRFQERQFHLLGRHPQVDPRRHLGDGEVAVAIKQQLGNDQVPSSCSAGTGPCPPLWGRSEQKQKQLRESFRQPFCR